MIVNPDALRKDTVQLLKLINEQIAEIEIEAIHFGVTALKMRDKNGAWVLPPLLLAKTQAYANLIALQNKS